MSRPTPEPRAELQAPAHVQSYALNKVGGSRAGAGVGAATSAAPAAMGLQPTQAAR